MGKGANGSGTVYKPKHPSKNLPFRAEVWITDLSRPEGKRRVSKNFKKRTDAEKWRDEMISKYGTNSNSLCDPMITLTQWLDYWLNNFCLNIKDSTKTGYECYINKHIAKHPIGKLKLKDLNVCDLQSYMSYLATDGNLRDGGGMNAKTIRSLILMIRKSLKTAIGAGIIEKNPAEYVILPKLEQKDIEYLTLSQIKALINASKHERWSIFFPLAFMTGCRIGELGALRRNSLKCENGIWYLSIDGSLNRVTDYTEQTDKKTVLRIGSTKNSKSRQIPLSNDLVTILQEHFQRQDYEASLCCGVYEVNPFIFSNQFGGFVDPTTLRNWAKGIAAIAGVENFYPHLLRKSFATYGASNMELKQLSAILGHSSVNVSTSYYIASDLTTKNTAIMNMHSAFGDLFSNCTV